MTYKKAVPPMDLGMKRRNADGQKTKSRGAARRAQMETEISPEAVKISHRKPPSTAPSLAALRPSSPQDTHKHTSDTENIQYQSR